MTMPFLLFASFIALPGLIALPGVSCSHVEDAAPHLRLAKIRESRGFGA